MAEIGHNSEGEAALQRIANDLNSELGEDIESIFRKGRKFLEYKKQLGHGQFLRLFASHRDPLPEPVRCHPRVAQRFMSVASNETLSNATFWSHLPSDFVLIYELSRIDPPGLAVAFSEGWITPFTRKKDVKEIRIRLGIDDEPAPKETKLPKQQDATPCDQEARHFSSVPEAVNYCAESVKGSIKATIFDLPPDGQLDLIDAIKSVVRWFETNVISQDTIQKAS